MITPLFSPDPPKSFPTLPSYEDCGRGRSFVERYAVASANVTTLPFMLTFKFSPEDGDLGGGGFWDGVVEIDVWLGGNV